MKFYVIQDQKTGDYLCGIQSIFFDSDMNKARKFTQANWAKNCLTYRNRHRNYSLSVIKVEFETFKEIVL